MIDQRDNPRQDRRHTYALFILIALAVVAGRIAVVINTEGDAAFLSANDRSRWSTVAALVEDGTYAIDRQLEITSAGGRHPWQTIDKVRHRGSDGGLHYYSSKPPLLATLVAGVYWLVHFLTGMTLTAQPVYAVRVVLALVNLPLLALFYVATIAAIDRIGVSDWGRRVAAGATCFGTMLMPFAVSLNNHLPAAAATAAAIWIYVYLAERHDVTVPRPSLRRARLWWFAAGVAAAFAAANELPALSMMCLWVVLFVWQERQSWAPLLAGIAVVAIAFFATNWLAHQSLRPPYAHRGNGEMIAEVQFADLEAAMTAIGEPLREGGWLAANESFQIHPSDEPQRWLVQTDSNRMFALVRGEAPRNFALRHWDDWYEYPGSYWQAGRRRGVDRGEPSRWRYLFHMTFGHHGLFSLTPIWLLMPVGLVYGVMVGRTAHRRLVAAAAVATVVCLAFYVARPEIDRNYGGVSTCFRWLLWFAPLWLVPITPVLDRLVPSRQGRILAGILLTLSVFSMATALSSPWQPPWLYQFWEFLGWIGS